MVESAEVVVEQKSFPSCIACKPSSCGNGARKARGCEWWRGVRGRSRVQVFGLDGTFWRQWGTEGRGEGHLLSLGDVALSVSGGEVFVSDCTIQVFGLDG